ncbi:unnamed protein product [Acanthoscelides obtectus]|uniref:Uncharacterized protein n=1 Tax=Acanthoscelides obtectus TaxID=200917 RepID=A0A9P0KL71_ACAOB|nr:unnamed protein product [Acanthoscelides obtectus]CAK1671683.1 hypothetical protein AOBTE_LOCUS28400 [Acanthoscelides obtectus]
MHTIIHFITEDKNLAALHCATRAISGFNSFVYA